MVQDRGHVGCVAPSRFRVAEGSTDAVADTFRTWHRGYDRTRAQRGIPEDLRLVPASFEASGSGHVAA